MIRAGTGNLLEADVEALVNTVNCVGVMGKGLALQFKKAYPTMFRDYAAAVRDKQIVPGQIHVWRTGLLVGPKLVLNFPTKRHWRANSQIDDIEAGLSALVAKIQELEIRSIAIPPLGAGNGGLQWSSVRPLIVAAMSELDGVDVVLWEPGGAPPIETRPVNTKRPQWTAARAAVIALMGQYRILDDDLTQLEVQKLAYFLQLAGCDLQLHFRKQFYGPYADPLYHMLQRLEGHFIHGLEDRTPHALLRVEPDAVNEANAYLAEHETIGPAFRRVSKLIEGFETPYGMELLATTHWVAREKPAAAEDCEAAVEAIEQWNQRKASTFDPAHIRTAWSRLHEANWPLRAAIR